MSEGKSTLEPRRGPMRGLRILELGSLIAGPFATHLMADFGAEVIKIEAPGKPDEIRLWRYVPPESGTSLWWHYQSRNKKCVTLDLRRPAGQDLLRRLVAKSDAVVENFRPGTLERWGLSYPQLKEVNPGIIMVSVSGFGQTGPLASQPGFASVAEGISGLRHLTGFPDRPPVRVGISLGDHIAAMYAAVGLLMALYHRDARGGEGQHIDVALYESIFTFTESLLPEYDVAGRIWERTGTTLGSTAPSNTYPTKDGKWVVIGANNDNLFRRLCRAMGREEMADDPCYRDNQCRLERRDYLDQVVAAWTSSLDLVEVVRALEAAEVPAGPIYTAAEIVNDRQYQARDMIITQQVPGLGPVKYPGIVPKFSATPGEVVSSGPAPGEHNREVYGQVLGLNGDEIAALEAEGII